MDENYKKYHILGRFNVPRETFLELDVFKELIIKKTKKLT